MVSDVEEEGAWDGDRSNVKGVTEGETVALGEKTGERGKT
jgi:hypothetical protein